jgi:hypothetical protein
MDLAQYEGHYFLISVDQFSGFPHVLECGKTATAKQIVDHTRTLMTYYSIPVTIYSDGGPQFFDDGEFDEFCKEWGIQHVKSSPYFAQSNGIAEGAVKEMKKLIRATFCHNTGKLDKSGASAGLLMFRNTPRSPTDLAPSEMLFGHLIRDNLPISRQAFRPMARYAIEQRLQQVREERDRRNNRMTRELPLLQPGQRVFIQHPATKRWTGSGSIVKFGANEREYWVIDDKNGKTYRRNRRFLRPQLFKPGTPPKQPVQAPTPMNESSAPAALESHGSRGRAATEGTTATGTPTTTDASTSRGRLRREKRLPVRFSDQNFVYLIK